AVPCRRKRARRDRRRALGTAALHDEPTSWPSDRWLRCVRHHAVLPRLANRRRSRDCRRNLWIHEFAHGAKCPPPISMKRLWPILILLLLLGSFASAQRHGRRRHSSPGGNQKVAAL